MTLTLLTLPFGLFTIQNNSNIQRILSFNSSFCSFSFKVTEPFCFTLFSLKTSTDLFESNLDFVFCAVALRSADNDH